MARVRRLLQFAAKFELKGPLFIGILAWTRRGLKVLRFLSINQSLIRLRLEDFWKGNRIRFGSDSVN
jgi:hypothetical protein